jgi:hypothetical protein
MVEGVGESTWVLSFRGPWANTWREFIPSAQRWLTLTHGRRVIQQPTVAV